MASRLVPSASGLGGRRHASSTERFPSAAPQRLNAVTTSRRPAAPRPSARSLSPLRTARYRQWLHRATCRTPGDDPPITNGHRCPRQCEPRPSSCSPSSHPCRLRTAPSSFFDVNIHNSWSRPSSASRTQKEGCENDRNAISERSARLREIAKSAAAWRLKASPRCAPPSLTHSAPC